MKKKIAALVCAAFAASSLIAAETVATFTSLTSGATSGTYSYGSHTSGSGGYVTGTTSWAASDGVTMILTYSGLPSSGDYAIATLARTDSTTYSYFGISSRSGRLTGFYKGSMWDTVKSGSTLASSGKLVFTFRANGTSNNGVTVYDDSANVIYSAPSLVESADFSIGEKFDFAGTDSGTFSADGFTVDSVEILNGALTANEVAEKLGIETDIDFSFVPGTAPKGWFTSWGGEASGSPRTTLGPTGTADSVYYVYAASTSDKWMPYMSDNTTRSTYTMAIYGSVDFISTPSEGTYSVLWGMGTKNGQKTVLAMDSSRNIVLASANGNTIQRVLSSNTSVKGWHLFTVTFDATSGATLTIDDGASVSDAEFTTATTAGFQIGSILSGCSTGFERGYGFSVLGMYGWDDVLSSDAIATLAATYPAVETISSTVTYSAGDSIYLPSITIPQGKQLCIQSGTLVVPASVEATLAALEFGDMKKNPSFGMELDGTINIVHNHAFTGNGYNAAYQACNAGYGVVLGEWTGYGTFNIRGNFIATNTIVELIHDSTSVALNVTGGVFRVQGVAAKDTGATINLTAGGTIDFGEYPCTTDAAIVKNYGNGTVTGTADWTDTDDIVLTDTSTETGTTFHADGVTLTWSGDISGDGAHTISEVNDGDVVLSSLEPSSTLYSIDWTVGDNTYTFDLLFRGTSDATFETLGNWYSNKFTIAEGEGGSVTNWIAYAESAVPGETVYPGMLLDGDLMALEASESGVKNVTAELQEGWNSKIGVKNGVNLTITHLNKMQKGSAGTAYWVVDDTSKITVTEDITNKSDSNKYGQFTGHTFDVASENGVVFNGTIGKNAANAFILHEAGSVAFADVTASGTWTVSATLDLGEAGDMAKEVVTRPLVTGNSLSAVTFSKGTIDALDGTALTEGTVTEDSAIGTYELVSSSTGYSVKYVKRASAEASTEVGGVTCYGTLQDMVALAGDGGTVTLYRALTESDATNCAATFTATETENVYTIALTKADSAALRISEIMPKGADGELDPNGFESGWIEFRNTSETAWVDLADYRLIRVNRGKKTDTSKFSNLATRLVPPGGYTIVYMTECYPNGPYGVGDDSRFINGDHSETDVVSYPDSEYFTDANPVMVFPAKVNPKKFPFLRLYYAPGATTLKGKMKSVVDTVIIPDDLPESASILLADAADGEATKRWICTEPTPGEANGDTANLKRIGPNVGPLYENSSLAKHSNVSAFGRLAPPAKAGEDYNITFSANPVMNPTGAAGEAARSEDAITSITLEYRIDLTNDVQAIAVDTNTLDTADMLDWGNTYTATIPQSVIDAVEPGHLIQWRFKLTDAEGNEWTSPSFNNSDDGYEWFGTIKEPDASLLSSKLTTMHLFAKPGVADTPGVHDADAMMNIDVDDSRYDATQARVAIYDSSTSNYYDYVRIDLRGNSSKDFRKKSHGLRFAKAHPITTYNCITGAMIPEVRKTSFIGEFCDPTEMRQLLAFWFFNRHNSPAPYDFPVRLNLNGEFYQLGFMSQRFNDELIEDCYGLDPLGYGYKNIGPFNGSSTSAGSIEKKTPDDGNESDLDELDEFCAKLPTDVATGSDIYSKVAAKEMDLPAWFNYIALSRITHECDDVWANISGYWDYAKMHDGARGTGTWRPLAYDMNLSFGQWYYNDVYNGKNEHDGPGLVSDWDWFKSHPFYGGFVVRAHRGDGGTTVGNANRAYEAIFQNEKFRRLYLRRLRTLMDSELGAPGSDTYETSELPLVVKIRELAELMAEDAALDRETWGQLGYTANGAYEVNVWGTQLPTNLTEAVADMWNNYFVPRRTHLFVTHSITNDANIVGYGTYYNAGIPESQSAIEDLKAGFSISNATDTDEDGLADTISDSEKVVITNANDEAVDMSGWKISGRFAMTLPEGTVIDQNGSIIVVVDRLQYVTDYDSEITDDIIVGNATLDDSTTSLTLSDANGTEVAKVVLPSDVSKYLRIFAFDGAPVADDDYGTDEWIMLTNISDTVTLDLTGVNIKVGKNAVDAKCNITLTSGTLAPGATIRLDQADYTSSGWEKITNGEIILQITDANGTIGHSGSGVVQKEFDGYKLENRYLQLTQFEAMFTGSDLIVVDYPETTIEVAPGANTVLDVTTAEEATNALANCEIALSAEDTAAGLVTNVLKLVVVDTGSGFAAAVDVDETKVASPVIGEITEGETTVEPMTVTKEKGGSKVTVGVTNATVGLWYGFEWATALDGCFADDAGSFKRATGASVKLEATPRTDAKAFYKVKVSASKPQEVQ